MTLAGSSETGVGGGTIATSTVGGKEHQVVMQARADGHIIGSRPDYMVMFPAAANAANRAMGAIFNASADKILRVRGIWLIPTQTVIVGAAMQYDINKINTAPTTGAVARTPRPLDSANVAANFTSISFVDSYTAGGALVHQWFPVYLYNEETAPPVGMIAYMNQLPVLGDTIMEIVLRQNEGVEVKQIAGAVGLTGVLMAFTIDN
jgi:hypothetical protein